MIHYSLKVNPEPAKENSMAWFKKRPLPQGSTFAVVDVETTGFKPTSASIVEIGVSVLDATFTEFYRWETLVNPGKSVRGTTIHGITTAMVRVAPPFAGIYTALTRVLEGTITIAHHAIFDCGFLGAAAACVYDSRNRPARPFSPGWVDSLDIAKQLAPRGQYKLQSLAELYGITNPLAHSAGDDAATAGKFLAAMCR